MSRFFCAAGLGVKQSQRSSSRQRYRPTGTGTGTGAGAGTGAGTRARGARVDTCRSGVKNVVGVAVRRPELSVWQQGTPILDFATKAFTRLIADGLAAPLR